MQTQLKPLDPIMRILRPALLVAIGLEALQACVSWVLAMLERQIARGEAYDEVLYFQISEGVENLDNALFFLAMLTLIPWVWMLVRAWNNTTVLEPRIPFVKMWLLLISLLVPPLLIYLLFSISCSIWRGSALKAEREQFSEPKKIPVPWYFYVSLAISFAHLLLSIVVLVFGLTWTFTVQEEFAALALWEAGVESLNVIDYAVSFVVLLALAKRHALRLQEYDAERELAAAQPAPAV